MTTLDTTDPWLERPQSLNLLAREVHVWRISVGDLADRLPELERLLSPTEHAQVARFRREADRSCRIVARSALRSLLAMYLQTSPHAVALAYGKHGKPMLDPSTHDRSVEFNIAHSGDVVLLAFSDSAAVGIDVEAARNDIDLSGLSARVLAAEEMAILERADAPMTSQLFFQIWARKEAVLKALGTGFSVEPSQVVVLTDSFSVSTSCICHCPAGTPRRLRVLDVAVGQEVAAAVAVEGMDPKLRCFTWRVGPDSRKTI